MSTVKILAVAIGLVLIAIAGILYVGEVQKPIEVTFNGPVFSPAPGTECFAFGTIAQNGEYTVDSTGIYIYNDQVFYGTLYTSDIGYWMVIDPRGQIPVSGNPGSPIPEVIT